MRGVIWFIGWAMVGLWSLAAWGSYAVFDAVTGLLRSAGTTRVDGFPDEPMSFPALIDTLHGLGFSMITIVWAAVSLLILGLALLLARLAGPSAPPAVDRRG